MDTVETRAAVDRILDTSLDDLSRSDGPQVLPASQLTAWNLPDQGKLALSSYGLPPARADKLLGLVGGFQASGQPEHGSEGDRFYVLGSYGTSRIVAIENTGHVLAIPSALDVHPDLADLHPSGILPSLVNSTVVNLVDCAWRWHWILPLIADEQRRAGEAEILAWRAGDMAKGMLDPYAEYQKLCNYILRRFQALDPKIQNHSDFWSEVIVDVW